jgi:hypothetical protein
MVGPPTGASVWPSATLRRAARDEEDEPGRLQDGIIDTVSASRQPGETLTNYDGRIEVEAISKGAGFYTVRVTRHSSG